MAVLYVAEQGAELHKRGERLAAEKFGEVIQEVHAFQLDQVVLIGNVRLTPSALSYLLDKGIDTVFLSYHGKFKGRLISQFGKNVALRQIQFAKFGDDSVILEVAKHYVLGKLANCRTLLRRFNAELQDEEIAKRIVGIRKYLERVESTHTIEELRGIEGISAVEYFQGFKKLIRDPGMRFDGRTRRPPRDEVNALLSFGYTLLGNLIQTSIYIAGLDPYLGCLHSVDYGRPSLALDLMEEFRPVLVDSVVLKCANKKMVTPRDFIVQPEAEIPPEGEEMEELTSEDYPVLLTHEGIKKFITQFEARLQERTFYLPQERRLTYRDICLEQVRKLVRHLKGEELYDPFKMR